MSSLFLKNQVSTLFLDQNILTNSFSSFSLVISKSLFCFRIKVNSDGKNEKRKKSNNISKKKKEKKENGMVITVLLLLSCISLEQTLIEKNEIK